MSEHDFDERTIDDHNTKNIWLGTLAAIFVYACAMGGWLYQREPDGHLKGTAVMERRETRSVNSEVVPEGDMDAGVEEEVESVEE